jgi:[CysO sulfur-carrier protein]-thiocarboxylate-dependent cysteine synthase
VLAKLEGMNPSGSLKDRCALFQIEEARSRGSLEGRTLLDASSGNLGTAIAMVGASYGLRVRLLVSNTITMEKRRSMELLGAELQFVDGTSLDAATVAREMAEADTRFLFLDQFNNAANLRAHYETTASEILRDVGEVAAYVCALGSGGSLIGVARRLRDEGLRARIHAVTAENGTRIPGLRNPGEEGGYPPLADMSLVDEERRVSSDMAKTALVERAVRDGLLLGLSGGAVLSVATELAASGKVRGNIVVLCGDSSFKYLSGALAN